MDKKTYKNLVIIGLAIITIVAILFIRSRINVPIEEGSYTGFLKPNQGAWSEVVFINEDNAENLQRSVYLGEKNIDNISAYGIEMESIDSNDKSAITQVWFDKESNEIIKIVSKLKGENEVVCIDDSLMRVFIPSFDSLLPAVKTPVQYGSIHKYTYGTFITETGKTIQTAKFIDENNMEVWLSSEVPFGIVKIIDRNSESGEIMAWLQDFDLSGAEAKISESEMLNCEKINFPDLTQ
jgi:hypothetical protein